MGELLRVAAAAHGGQKPGTSDSVLPGNPPPLAQRRRRLNVYSHAVPPWDVRSCITLSLSLWLFFRRLLCVIALCPSLSLSLSSLLPIPSCTLPLSLWPFHRRLLSLSLSVCCSLSLSPTGRLSLVRLFSQTQERGSQGKKDQRKRRYGTCYEDVGPILLNPNVSKARAVRLVSKAALCRRGQSASVTLTF